MFHKTTPGVLFLDFGRYGQGMRPFKVMDLNLLIDAVEKAKGRSIGEAMESFLSALDDIFSSPGSHMRNLALRGGGNDDRIPVAYLYRQTDRRATKAQDRDHHANL